MCDQRGIMGRIAFVIETQLNDDDMTKTALRENTGPCVNALAPNFTA